MEDKFGGGEGARTGNHRVSQTILVKIFLVVAMRKRRRASKKPTNMPHTSVSTTNQTGKRPLRSGLVGYWGAASLRTSDLGMDAKGLELATIEHRRRSSSKPSWSSRCRNGDALQVSRRNVLFLPSPRPRRMARARMTARFPGFGATNFSVLET